MSNSVKIYAHRGAPNKFPENTLATFQQALEDGADGFECDIALTKDAEPVVIHIPFYSDNILNLTGVPAKLSKIDWVDLKKIRIQGQPIMHLNDLLEFVANNKTECFIEPKRTSSIMIEKLVRKIEEYKVTEKITLVTFYSRKELFNYSKQLNPNIKTSVILISPFGNWHKLAETANADIVIPGWKKYNHLKLLESLGVNINKKIKSSILSGTNVLSGEADDEANINWLCELGIKGIFTNDVPLTRKVIKSYFC